MTPFDANALGAKLATLARVRKGELATFNRGLAAVHADVAVWIGGT